MSPDPVILAALGYIVLGLALVLVAASKENHR